MHQLKRLERDDAPPNAGEAVEDLAAFVGPAARSVAHATTFDLYVKWDDVLSRVQQRERIKHC